MKLLIVTQKVDKNDDVLGFFNAWITEFARRCEKVTVICLERGTFDLPSNVTVLSLGKEEHKSRLMYIIRLKKYLWQHRKNYDTVFVHMNPIYLVLAGWWWRMTGKKMGLWYTHRQVDLKLRIAALIAGEIFTAAPESFSLKTGKLHVVGHGIDTSMFSSSKRATRQGSDHPVKILSVGRLTPIKDCLTLVEAAAILRQEWNRPFMVTFIGKAATDSDAEYEREVRALVVEKGVGNVVEFAGSIPNSELPEQYKNADLSVNLTPTGGIDKVVLESFMACVPAIVSNEAFRPIFGKYQDKLIFEYKNAQDLASKIMHLHASHEQEAMVSEIKDKIRSEYTVSRVVSKIMDILNQDVRTK